MYSFIHTKIFKLPIYFLELINMSICKNSSYYLQLKRWQHVTNIARIVAFINWLWKQFVSTYQWRRRVWRKADSPSINSRMVTVSTAHGVNTINSARGPIMGLLELIPIPRDNTMFQSTSDNSASIGNAMVNACAWSYIIYVCLIAYCIHIIIIYLGMKYKQQIY